MLKYFRDEFSCIFERDPAARTQFEILTTYPGVQAILIHRLTHRLWCRGYYWPARFLAYLARFVTGIEIHPAARIGHRCFIDHGMGVVIGETAEIGDDCTLYHAVTLGGVSWNRGKRHPTLGNGVIVGAGAKILGPITIGDGARIGSNAVVTKTVPPGGTIIGPPGRLAVTERGTQVDRQATDRTREVFIAYGVDPDSRDPVARSIHLLLEHVTVLEAQVAMLRQRLPEPNATVIDVDLPDLKDCQLDNDK